MDEETHPIMTPGRKHDQSSKAFKYSSLCLVVAIILAMAGLAMLVAGVGIVASGTGCSSDSSPCETPDCVKLASLVLGNMDTSFDPCDDFYNFSCAAWEQSNIVPPGYARYSTFDQLGDRNNVQLYKVLSHGDSGGIEAVEKVNTLYRSCMDTKSINSLGAGPLLDLLNETGGWTLLQTNHTAWSINGSASFLAEKGLGSPAFFSWYVDVDDKNSSAYILNVQQSGLSLPGAASYMGDASNTTLPALTQLIVAVLTVLEPSGLDSAYQEAAEDIVDFETQLAEVFVDNVALRNIDLTYNKMMLSNLSHIFPLFDWIGQISAQFSEADVTITGREPVIVRTPSYLHNLTQIFAAANTSVHENYAKWQLVMSYLPYLSEEFTSALDKFNDEVSGSGGGQRYKECIEVAQDIMPIALAKSYTDFVLPNGTKESVSEMITEVKNAFKARLDANTWLDDTTRQRSKDKVDAITQMVAYPDQIDNATYLNELYEELNITEDYFDNAVSSVVVGLMDNIRSLRKPVDKSQWLNAPTAVNAYYSPQFNQFVFLEGILNTPFFQAGWPDYFKYGALGVVIGHELTHGFDDQGQRYDKDGILTPWWTNASVEEFQKRQECFVKQYSEYELLGYHVNGSLTLGENIADNGGVKAAFQAYQKVMGGKTPESLPGLTKYSADQLFFISFGQVWCSLFTPEGLSVSTQQDPHSPGPYRVVGALVNSDDFATAFKCPKGAPMNPPEQDKCKMW